MNIRQQTKAVGRKILSVLLTASVSFAVLPCLQGIQSSSAVQAAWTKSSSNTRLGVTMMANPTAPSHKDDPWKGSYVYFGKYDGTPIRFRVLSRSTNKFGVPSLFLDSDQILFFEWFDEDAIANSAGACENNWAYSDLRNMLNSSGFLTRSNGFTAAERNAITTSVLKGGQPYASGSFCEYVFGSNVGLNYDKVFLLDAADILNSSYGYYPSSGYIYNSINDLINGNFEDCTVNNHIKNAIYDGYVYSTGWWLRACDPVVSDMGVIIGDYGPYSGAPVNLTFGVAPSLNIKQTSILFTSLVSGTSGKAGAEYKLTIIDPNMSVSLPSGSAIREKSGTVAVPFKISGSNSGSATRVSILITDKAYDASGANMLYYDKLNVASFPTSGEGWFQIPSSISGVWGTDFHVYMIAEDINDTHYTDYASTPCEILPPKPVITKAEPTDNGVSIRWNAVNGKDSYNIYRSDSQNGAYSYLASVTGGTLKYTDKTAKGGKTYYYKIRPYNKSGTTTWYGIYSDPKKITVLSDLKLTVEPKSGVTMTLSWTAVSGAQSYEIWRSSSSSGPYTLLKSTTGTSTSDTGLTAGTRYYYMVRAKKTVNGEAQYSKYAAGVAVALATPTMESATFKSGKGVTLKWTKASGADRYNVYKYNTSTGKYDYVASVLGGTLTYTDSKGKKGDYYKVRAYKRVDGVVYYGGWSNAKAGK
ncbi:MAG: hypothetical protein J5379_02105 [Clostridiales bacterium]|nr:hypothetical protein [Clostridiales bacterium]